MTKIYFSDRTKTFTRKVFEALLTVAYQDKGDRDKQIKLKCEWQSVRQIKFEIGKEALKKLVGSATEKQFNNEIQPAIVGYLSEILGILTETGDPTGSGIREFLLDLWDEDKDKNLTWFDEEWDKKANEHKKSKPKPSKSSRTATPITSQIDWLTECKTLLEKHKQQLSSNPLQGLQSKNFDVYVPLGLVKREKKERPQIDRDLDPPPERGSDLYRVETTPIEHDDFLRAVSDRQPGEHVVILGEPGAGKTTLLTRVWEWLLDRANPEEPSIVAWIPLATLGDRSLEDYVEELWLRQVCEKEDKPAYLASLTSLRQAGRLCLLLDGADEIGGNGLKKIEEYLLQSKWAKQIKSVVTCRLNLWDGSSRNELKQNFQIFRTLDFKTDEVTEFIEKWFEEPATGQKLRAALDEPGKERIKDLAQNPLRLTLLCNIWLRDQGLPDTQAGLYEVFVKYTYGWSKVPDAVELQSALDPVMGKLAKYGINQPSLRFRFTEDELQAQVPDLQQRKALKDLGWLNCVGEDEAGKEVYAFFHPTFQEYFAACSIDDWDYFLPRAHLDRPVPCQGEDMPTYRVFEQEWRQVILLWIGRSDLGDERTDVKEEFIKNLTNFDERLEVGKIYYYRAYCMAAICISEFKSSLHAKAITEKIVRWALGYFNTEKNEWIFYKDYIQDLARDIIYFIDSAYAINSLIECLLHPQCDYLFRTDVANILGRIGVGSIAAISALSQLLRQPHIDDSFPYLEIRILGQIGVGHPDAIVALIQLLVQPDLQDSDRYSVLNALYQNGIRNTEAISTLIQRLGWPDLDDRIYSDMTKTLLCMDVDLDASTMIRLFRLLGVEDQIHPDVLEVLDRIGMGDSDAIVDLLRMQRILRLEDEIHSSIIEAARNEVGHSYTISDTIQILQPEDVDDLFYADVVEILGQIDRGNPAAISDLIKLLLQPDLDDRLHSDVLEILAQIGVENSYAISDLIQLLLQSDLDTRLRINVVRVLGQIGEENPEVTAALLQLLLQPDLDNLIYSYVLDELGKISIGNSAVIAALIQILVYPTSTLYYFSEIVKQLEKILTKATMLLTVSQLKSATVYVFLLSNSRLFEYYCQILFHCGKTLSYPEFYTAWDQNEVFITPQQLLSLLPINKWLNQLFDILILTFAIGCLVLFYYLT
jgi:HEAT repeat protein/GTPase SAR1 family protein